MSGDEPLRLTVEAGTAGRPAAAVAAELLGTAGAAAAARGGIWLNGQRLRDVAQPLPAGGELVIRRPPGGCYRNARISRDDVIYADDTLLVLNKPAGFPVGATPWDDVGHVLAAARRLLHVEGDAAADELQLAHQLDSGTSGVLVLMRRRADYGALQRQFAAGAQKVYLAVAAGRPEQPQAMFDGHGRSAHGRWRLYPGAAIGDRLPDGSRIRRAEALLEQITPVAAGSLLRIRLLTGRTHQIRLQLAARGWPVIGDTRYGGPPGPAADVLLLHAAELQLQHPRDGRLLRLQAEPPALFSAAAEAVIP